MRRLILKALILSSPVLMACSLAAAAGAIVVSSANLRRDPSTAQAPLLKLSVDDEVELVEPGARNDYYHVRTENGVKGWVYGRSLELEAETPAGAASVVPRSRSAPAISPGWEKPKPNRTQLTGSDGICGPTGDGEDTKTNTRKNRTDVPTSYHDVDWDAIASLDYPVAPKSRTKWKANQLAQIAPYEGVAIRTVGFLAVIRPQTGGSGESTNCHFTKADEVDWHMALVQSAGDKERTSVVIETTPRVRQSHPNWSPQALADWVTSDQPVRISGWLMLDPEHRNHLDKYRSTLWEIHPITKIEVRKENQWVDLDDNE